LQFQDVAFGAATPPMCASLDFHAVELTSH
jgi:hypothetical protein